MIDDIEGFFEVHKQGTRPHRGAYSAPPDLLAASKGPTSKGREGMKGRVGIERGGEGERGGKRRGGEGPHINAGTRAPSYFATLGPPVTLLRYCPRGTLPTTG